MPASPHRRSSPARRAVRLAVAGLALSLTGALSLFGAGAAFAADSFFTPVAATDADGTVQNPPLTTAPEMSREQAAVAVAPVANTAPTANPDTYSMVQGDVLAIDEPGVLANDTDADGDALHASSVQGIDSATTVLNQAGWLKYMPDPSFTGVTTFQYRSSDGEAESNWATVTITVTPKPELPQPVANPDAYSVMQGDTLHVDAAGILANDTSASGEQLAVAPLYVGSNPVEGLAVNADGSFTLTTEPSYVGDFQFSYAAIGQDSLATSNVTTVTVTVLPRAASERPVAQDDQYTTSKDVPLVIPAASLLANDSLPNGDIADWYEDAGEVSRHLDGSFVYTPAQGFVGTKTFTYNMAAHSDDPVSIQSNWATVTITVTDPGTAPGPGAAPDPGTKAEGTTLAQTGGADSTPVAWAGAALLLLGVAASAIPVLRRGRTRGL